jgi:hypothetical protein
MSNYYTQFKTIIKQEKLEGKKLPLSEFQQKLKISFGFGGRNKTIDRWIANFQDVGFIKLQFENGTWFVIILKDKQK